MSWQSTAQMTILHRIKLKPVSRLRACLTHPMVRMRKILPYYIVPQNVKHTWMTRKAFMSLVKIFQSDAESFRAFPNISKFSSASQCLRVLS